MAKYPRLKDLRNDKDLNQTQIAKMIGTTQKQYSRWETGEFTIPFDIVIKLSDIYNVSLDYIAGRTNNKNGIGNADTFNIFQQNNNNGNINNNF